jgi:hypothetical protein
MENPLFISSWLQTPFPKSGSKGVSNYLKYFGHFSKNNATLTLNFEKFSGFIFLEPDGHALPSPKQSNPVQPLKPPCAAGLPTNRKAGGKSRQIFPPDFVDLPGGFP